MVVNIYNKKRCKMMDYKIISADFETHADDITIKNWLNNDDSSRIGIWLACTLDDYHDNDWNTANIFDYNIKDWVTRLLKYVESENVLCFFFNLAYDFTYFVTEFHTRCISLGYTDSYCGKSSFSTVYSYKVDTGSHELIIKDMRLLLGAGSLAGNSKALGLKHQKLDFSDDDYTRDRYIHPVTDNDKEYCYYDTACVLEMCEYFSKTENYKEFFESCTAASYASTLMIKETYGTQVVTRTSNTYNKNRSVISVSHKGGSKMKITPIASYHKFYPNYLDTDTLARKAYHGGICHPFYRYGMTTTGGFILHLDFASLYPSVVYKENRWPCGKPKKFNGFKKPESNYFDFYHIRWTYTGRAKMICDIPSQALNDKWEIKTGEEFYESYICDFELETYKKCYPKFEYTILETERYSSTAQNPFRNYMNTHFILKQQYGEQGNKAKKAIEKMLLNSPTGKLGEKPHNSDFQLDFDDNGCITLKKIDTEKVKPARYTYVPLIAAITAYGRKWLTNMAEVAGFSNCIYCDTDSLFIYNKNKEDGLKLLDKYNEIGVLHNQFGGFELEDVGTCFTTPCAKKYSWFSREFDYKNRDYKAGSSWNYVETISGVNELTGLIDLLNSDDEQMTNHSRLTPKGRIIITEAIKFQPTNIMYSNDTFIKGSRIISPEDVKMLKQKDKPAIKTEKDKENFNLKYKRLERCCDK